MTDRTVLALAATLLLGCQQAPERYVLWSGEDVPLKRAALVSTHDSKAACQAARDEYAAIMRGPEHVGDGKPDKNGNVWLVSKTGEIRGFVCHPAGIRP